MKATGTSFAATDDTVAILMGKFHLMAGFPQRSVCLPGNPDLRLQYSLLNAACLYR